MVKDPPANAGNMGSIPGLGRSPGEGDGHPTPGFLPEEILMDRGAWWVTVQGGRKETDRTERLSNTLSIFSVAGPFILGVLL